MDELIPKPDWGPGSWQDEPDALDWIDDATKLACAIRRNMYIGQLCGYVGVPPGHALFGWSYDDDVPGRPSDDTQIDRDVGIFETFIHALGEGREHGTMPLSFLLKAHQGINWSGGLPGDEDPRGLWWFGFDCGHYTDLAPGLETTIRRVTGKKQSAMFPRSVYRTIDYVRKEVTHLAWQLAQLEQHKFVAPRRE